jgi:hypothetical protein
VNANTPHPWQVPRLQEILAGKKFWGYLDTEALQSRYVLAAHFVKDARNIVEIGGYRDNVITRFLTGTHDSVSVFSLDAEFETFEAETLNGAPCRVRHVSDYFQNYTHATGSLAVIVLGIEILGDFDPLCNLLSKADVAVIEVPIDHAPSVDCLGAILQRTDLLVAVQINLDLSPNEFIIGDELAKTNMNKPFWKRNVYVLRR